MNYTEKTKSGMGDPYWYEWSVGEQQIINMLNEDNNIEFVELQANVGLGLDDVVVTYSDGRVSRVILSTSEPYVLLQSPAIWPYQENKLLNVKIDEFEVQGEDGKEEMLKNIFNMGLSDNEIVLGGALTDYSYKKELIGFLTTYIDFPIMKREYALYACERNVRLLIHRSDELVEGKNCNLLVHNVGVESFKGSNIMCMFSQRALNHFGWKIVFDNGLKIIDSNNEMIGRFEYYYGLRTDMGNSIYMNQPVIQRWVITKEAFTEIQNMLIYNLKQVANANVYEF